jgi:hypothetical protein
VKLYVIQPEEITAEKTWLLFDKVIQNFQTAAQSVSHQISRRDTGQSSQNHYCPATTWTSVIPTLSPHFNFSAICLIFTILGYYICATGGQRTSYVSKVVNSQICDGETLAPLLYSPENVWKYVIEKYEALLSNLHATETTMRGLLT